MSKKNTTKGKAAKQSVKSKEIVKAPAKEETEDRDDIAHDFGGIPSRDLKKNLGCG